MNDSPDQPDSQDTANAFQESDAEFFFGRVQVVNELLQRINELDEWAYPAEHG